MTTRGLADALEQLRGQLALLYMQNCCKSSLSVLYELRDVATYVLASQPILGAPNAYYTRFIEWAGQTERLDGLEAAQAICAHEDPEQFGLLAAFSMAKLDSFLNSLEHVLHLCSDQFEHLSIDQQTALLAMLQETRIDYTAGGLTDSYVCVQGFCRALNEHAEASTELQAAQQQLEESFCQFRVLRVQSPLSLSLAALSGLSVYCPCAAGWIGRIHYSAALDYNESVFDLLFHAVPSLRAVYERMVPMLEVATHQLRDSLPVCVNVPEESRGCAPEASAVKYIPPHLRK